MELSITKEKVLEAADKCPQAKETLKTLFPEVFQVKVYINPKALADFINDGKNVSFELFENIPGKWSIEKAEWIINLIKTNIK